MDSQNVRVATDQKRNLELDFSGLLGFMDSTVADYEKPTSGVSIDQDNETHSDNKAVKTDSDGCQRVMAPALAREAEKQKILNDRSLEICQEYQRQISLSAQLRSEILIGSKSGEPVEELFLKAVQAISLMTGDTVFLNNVESYLKSGKNRSNQE